MVYISLQKEAVPNQQWWFSLPNGPISFEQFLLSCSLLRSVLGSCCANHSVLLQRHDSHPSLCLQRVSYFSPGSQIFYQALGVVVLCISSWKMTNPWRAYPVLLCSWSALNEAALLFCLHHSYYRLTTDIFSKLLVLLTCFRFRTVALLSRI